MSPVPEFSRPVRVDSLGPSPRTVAVEAGDSERAALARRFDLVAIDRLSAEAKLSVGDDTVTASGRLKAAVTQRCVATAEPVAAEIDEQFMLYFRPPPRVDGEEEIELSASEMDVVFYEGDSIDLGEAVAETLLLALDLYPRAPDAEAALEAAGVKREEEAGPFAALAALKGKLEP
jgi:uncharacterized metal-binding protein YceD (DUF177 family)